MSGIFAVLVKLREINVGGGGSSFLSFSLSTGRL